MRASQGNHRRPDFRSGRGTLWRGGVAVDAVCAETSVPSIVRRLARGDVPTTVWWTADLSRTQPPDAMVETARQFLYDSAAWEDARRGARAATAILALPRAPDLADLNWQRLAALRAAIVHGLENEPRATSLQPAGVTIRHHAGERAAAWLVAGWLRSGMKWSAPPAVEESNDDNIVKVLMAGQAGS